jgi:hypothetical protein
VKINASIAVKRIQISMIRASMVHEESMSLYLTEIDVFFVVMKIQTSMIHASIVHIKSISCNKDKLAVVA